MGSPFYRLHKISHCRPDQQSALLAVDRPIDWPMVKFLTVEPAIDRPGRPWPGTEIRALCRLTDPVDRGFPESRSSLAVDRPSSQSWRARLCTSVDRLGRPTCTERARQSGWRAGRPTRSTDPVDRRAQNVHASLAGGPVDRPESKAPVDRPGRPAPTVEFLTVGGRPGGRPSGHLAPNG